MYKIPWYRKIIYAIIAVPLILIWSLFNLDLVWAEIKKEFLKLINNFN